MDSYRGEANHPLSLNLYAYCEGNPIKYIDKSGDTPTVIIGAITGAVIGIGWDVASQIAEQLLTTGKVDLRSINVKRTIISGVEGAISGGLAGLTGGASLLADKRTQALMDFSIGATADIAYQKADGTKSIDYIQSINSGLISAVSGHAALKYNKTSLADLDELEKANKTILKKGKVSKPKTSKRKKKSLKKGNYKSKKAYRKAKHKAWKASKNTHSYVQRAKSKVNSFKNRVHRVVPAVCRIVCHAYRNVRNSTLISSALKRAKNCISSLGNWIKNRRC